MTVFWRVPAAVCFPGDVSGANRVFQYFANSAAELGRDKIWTGGFFGAKIVDMSRRVVSSGR
jgi:hypothetical protein